MTPKGIHLLLVLMLSSFGLMAQDSTLWKPACNVHFSMGKRKQVITRTYAEMKDIDLEQLRAMLFEAAILDRSN
jgi:hypothetical protein